MWPALGLLSRAAEPCRPPQASRSRRRAGPESLFRSAEPGALCTVFPCAPRVVPVHGCAAGRLSRWLVRFRGYQAVLIHSLVSCTRQPGGSPHQPIAAAGERPSGSAASPSHAQAAVWGRRLSRPCTACWVRSGEAQVWPRRGWRWLGIHPEPALKNFISVSWYPSQTAAAIRPHSGSKPARVSPGAERGHSGSPGAGH